MKGAIRKCLRIRVAVAGVALATAVGGFTWIAATIQEDEMDDAMPNIKAKPLPLTMACRDLAATVAQTEGPYHTPDTPNRANLVEPGMRGTPLVFEGRILTTDCEPVASGVIDIWNFDADGVYHNDGYTLRGFVFSDEEGWFRIETIRPRHDTSFGMSRTPHIHAKLHGPGTRLPTTQIYFPDRIERNAKDGIFHESLLLAAEMREDGKLHGPFDFVLDRAA